MSIRENIERVRSQIEDCCAKAGIDPAAVRLVGVSKTVDAAAVQEAYDAGLLMFGENRVQEFLKKSEKLPRDIKWNLIGQLQTNKVKYIINQSIFLLHSLDRIALAEELQRQCEKNDTRIDALIQMNLSREETKAGLYEEDLNAFLDATVAFDRVRLRGMMTIGPNTEDETAIRRVFARAKAIYDCLVPQFSGFDYLSMGMSHDFLPAIQEGSNMVRVGTAVFGARDYTA